VALLILKFSAKARQHLLQFSDCGNSGFDFGRIALTKLGRDDELRVEFRQ
jgi:hypothetical protein